MLTSVLTWKVYTALTLPVKTGSDAFLGKLSTVFGLTRVARDLKVTLAGVSTVEDRVEGASIPSLS